MPENLVNEDIIEEIRTLIEKIDKTFYKFFEHTTAKITNKTAARRARKATLKLEKLMKTYRKISIK